MRSKLATFIFLVISISACQQKPDYVRLSGFTMGTTYHVTVKLKSQDQKQLQLKIDQRLDEINQLMSTYIDDSELSIFNQTMSTKCLPLSKETLFVIKNALAISHQTKGKFDVTLAPLIKLWGFDKKQTNDQVPSQQRINQLLQQIGYQKLIIKNNCIAKQSGDLSVNLSAIAKGYAVDEIAKILADNNINNYLVEIGGEVANQGLNPKGADWNIAIESPTSTKQTISRIISPKGMGIATSGDYRNYFEKDGQRYSHTIDPTNGYPITHNLASITVLHQQTILADALATAMMVMGEKQSLQFANNNNIAMFMLVKTEQGFKEVYSEAFSAYIR